LCLRDVTTKKETKDSTAAPPGVSIIPLLEALTNVNISPRYSVRGWGCGWDTWCVDCRVEMKICLSSSLISLKYTDFRLRRETTSKVSQHETSPEDSRHRGQVGERMAVRLLHRHRPGPRCQGPLCASHPIPPVQDVSLLATDLSLVSHFPLESSVSLDRHTKYTHARTNSQSPVSITTYSQNNLPVNLRLRHVETYFCRCLCIHLAMPRLSPSRTLCSLLALLLSVLLALSPSTVSATSLTYQIDANEKACFYAWVDKVGEKMAFYFAVLPYIPSFSLRHILVYDRADIWAGVGTNGRVVRY